MYGAPAKGGYAAPSAPPSMNPGYAAPAPSAAGGWRPQEQKSAPLPGGGGGGAPRGKKPKKYIKTNGVMGLNPEYTAWMANKGQPATTALSSQAMPVVSTMEDAMEFNQASQDAGYGAVPLAATTDATIEMMQEDDITIAVGLSSDEMVDGLGQIFSKYEAPIGLMNKLMAFTEFDYMEFLVDDSGSMGLFSDVPAIGGKKQTRWMEAQARIKSMFEVLAFVPTPPLLVTFLNRKEQLQIVRRGENPDAFLKSAYQQIDQVFSKRPNGSTPALQKLQMSFQHFAGKRVARYFFGDGEPDGGETAKEAIAKLVTSRKDPAGNPVTFLSCTNDDSAVEWMKDCEEIAPYCSEYDDFADEAREILMDQGPVLPFTRGFHLIGQLVAAMNPEDLDMMDESVPFTKFSFDNLLGITSSPQEYKKYFDGFMGAQSSRRAQSRADQFKQSFDWGSHYPTFTTSKMVRQIPVVQQFFTTLAQY